MKKWTAVLLTGAMFAATCLGGTITAFAGVTTEKPIGGKGLVSGTGINNKFTVEDDGDPSSYEVVAGDFSLDYGEGEWQEMLVNKGVPAATMAKENVKVDLIYKITDLPADSASGQLLITPGSSIEDKFTYGYVLVANASLAEVSDYRTSKQSSDPASKVIYHMEDTQGTEYDIATAGERGYAWRITKLQEYINTTSKNHEVFFRIRATLNEDKTWCNISLAAGFDQWGGGEIAWVVGNYPSGSPENGACTVTNWAPYDSSKDFHLNVWSRYVKKMRLDGAKLEVSYTESGDTKKEVLFNSGFDNESEVVTGAGAAVKDNCFIAREAEYVAATNSEVVVTNPQADSRLVSTKDLKAIEGLTDTFTVKARYRFYAMGDGNKVGIAFGLKDKDAKLSAPGTDVTFLYLTKSGDADVKIGVDNIAANGDVTAVNPKEAEEPLSSIQNATIADTDPKYIKLVIKGTSATSFTVTAQVGSKTTTSLTFDNVHLDGRFAFAQTGEGNVKYGIRGDTVDVTSYKFTENEGEKVTANFDGNYISYGKFDVNSTTATAGEMVKRDTTAHDITGITEGDGRVGFYGTGTNTRLMFKEQYSDFVLQFDYISETYKQRGESLVASKIYNPLMMTFGVKGDGSIQTLDAGYGIAIIDGNPGQGQWGGESIVMCHAATKFASEGLGGTCTTVLSTLKEAAAESDTTILASGGDLNGKWCEPNVDPDTGYSFYNRTTRIKLVVLNNKFTVYIAPVETDGTVGDYREVLTGVVSDSKGYVGFATDSPAWCAIDNVALTPISKDVAIAQAANPTYDETIVADVAPEDMEKDIAPAPLEKPQLTIDGTKVKWQAIDGVEYYHVVVTLGGETKLDKIYVNPEADLSTITAPGDYTVKVTAIPADLENHFESSATITYTVAEAAAGGDTNTQEEGKKGCGSAIGGWAAGGILLTAAAAVLIALPRRKKNK